MRNFTLRAFFLIVLFTSCSPYRHGWKRATIKANCPVATYVKIYLPTCNTFSGMEAEFIYSNGNLELNLNIHSLQFPSDPSDCAITTVQVTIGDDTFAYYANRLLGGQRLNMPYEACDQILNALLDGNDVDIQVGRYQTTLLSEGFAKHYCKLG